MNKTASFIVIVLMMLAPKSFAYETNVHKLITINAIASSNLDKYVMQNLGFSLESYLGDKKGSKWMEAGSDWEDNTFITLFPFRYLNHFYDPITDKGILAFPSSLKWAKSHDLNAWSWKKAREYFKSALTGEMTNSRNRSLS